jgi:hypothetical protein
VDYPDVSLVYARADEDFSRSVLEALTAEGVVVADLNAFAGPERQIADMVAEANNACSVILYLASEAANASIFVRQEVAPMVKLGIRRRDPALIPVLLDESSIPQSLAKLRMVQRIDAVGLDSTNVMGDILRVVTYRLSKSRGFVSHSSKDRETVRQILQDLERIDPCLF